MSQLDALASVPLPRPRPARPAPSAGATTGAAAGYQADALALGAGARIFPKPPVIQMPSTLFESRAGQAIDMIVLHHTGAPGTAEEVGAFFQGPDAEVSAHYVVGKDGAIVQSVRDDQAAWHAGPSEYEGRERVSRYSLGIELANLGDGRDPYTDAQYMALARLVLHLQERHGVPTERIVGHKDVAMPRGRKVDPSENFSYDRLLAEIARLRG